MIDTLQLYNELKETLDSSAAEKIAKTIGLVYDELQVVATKSKSNGLERQAEFQNQTKHMSGLEAALEQLAIAQAKTEVAMRQTNIRIDRLVATQAKTELALEQLSKAQAKTEATVEQTNIRIDRLAEAQAKTEATVEQTNIRMDRVEASIDRLTEALEQTNSRIDRQNKQLGGLSNAIGGDIEDIAYIVLHKVLNREFGWQVGELKRMWQNWSEQPEEVDIMGQAVDPTRPEKTIWIVGEAKHNMTEKGVRRFIKQLERARLHLDGEIFPVCFCYRARPEVQELIANANIRLVFSYGELV